MVAHSLVILILLIVSKWSTDEVADWLTNVVHLPQYAEVFKGNKVDGHHLPRYCNTNYSFHHEYKLLCNDYSETRNLIGRHPCRFRPTILHGMPVLQAGFL